MADNLGYTPGSGATVATEEVAGVHHQKVLMEHGGADGVTPTVAMPADPMPVAVYGELIEAIESMRFAIHALTRTIGQSIPDPVGRMRVLAENPTAANLQATMSLASGQTLATLTTLTTLTNQTQVGGNPAFEQIPALMRLGADSLRRNITVT